MPCKQLRPTLDELAAKYTQVKFRYADFDHEKDLVREFGVQTIPHLVFLIDNVIEETFRGAPPRERLIRSLDEAIANARKTAHNRANLRYTLTRPFSGRPCVATAPNTDRPSPPLNVPTMVIERQDDRARGHTHPGN